MRERGTRRTTSGWFLGVDGPVGRREGDCRFLKAKIEYKSTGNDKT